MSTQKNSFYKLSNGVLLNNRYEIHELLGAGGFGNTYLARDTRFSASTIFVCVKEFFISNQCVRAQDGKTVVLTDPTNLNSFEDMRRRFRREAERMFTLRDEHIVRVSDLFDENATSYYVMDYVTGRSLAQIVAQSGALDEPEALRYILQLLQGLRVIHRIGMVHLDIKPGNVMVDNEGRVILIDFGASKIIEPDARTLSAVMLNTPGYAPLEQTLVRLDRIGEWTDLYAVGGTLFKLVTGHTPANAQEIIEENENAFKFPDHVSQPVRELILWMMDSRIANRPHSTDEVISRIEKVLQESANTPTPKPTTPPSKTTGDEQQPGSRTPQPSATQPQPNNIPASQPNAQPDAQSAVPLFTAGSPKSTNKSTSTALGSDISILSESETKGLEIEEAVAVAPAPQKAKPAAMEAETIMRPVKTSKKNTKPQTAPPAPQPTSPQPVQQPVPSNPFTNPTPAASPTQQMPYNGYGQPPQGQPTAPYGQQTAPYGQQTAPYGQQTAPYGIQPDYPYQTNPTQQYPNPTQQYPPLGYGSPTPADDKTELDMYAAGSHPNVPNRPLAPQTPNNGSAKNKLVWVFAFLMGLILVALIYIFVFRNNSSSSMYNNYFDEAEIDTTATY